jgi:hypothetical protein
MAAEQASARWQGNWKWPAGNVRFCSTRGIPPRNLKVDVSGRGPSRQRVMSYFAAIKVQVVPAAQRLLSTINCRQLDRQSEVAKNRVALPLVQPRKFSVVSRPYKK